MEIKSVTKKEEEEQQQHFFVLFGITVK